MKFLLRIVSIILLTFNGAGAIYGGWVLMSDPSGDKIKLPSTYLEGTLFTDYFIPGLILFTVNGLFSFLGVIFTVFKWKAYPALIMAQGVILTGWIIIQMIMIQVVYFLHYVMGGTGLLLIVCGFLLHSRSRHFSTG